jgi:hypothetical protein
LYPLYYPITKVLESIFLSVVLGDTIEVRRPIDLSTKAFMISRPIRIHVFSDALPLEGVPTWVTRVDNNVHLKTTCISYMYVSSTTSLCVK